MWYAYERACMHTCMSAYVHECIRAWVHACICVCGCICMCLCLYVCICGCTRVRMCMCMHVNLCKHVHVCICIYWMHHMYTIYRLCIHHVYCIINLLNFSISSSIHSAISTRSSSTFTTNSSLTVPLTRRWLLAFVYITLRSHSSTPNLCITHHTTSCVSLSKAFFNQPKWNIVFILPWYFSCNCLTKNIATDNGKKWSHNMEYWKETKQWWWCRRTFI